VVNFGIGKDFLFKLIVGYCDRVWLGSEIVNKHECDLSCEAGKI
jgi:hypothetical protein